MPVKCLDARALLLTPYVFLSGDTPAIPEPVTFDALALLWIHAGVSAVLSAALLALAALRPGTRALRGVGISLLGISVANTAFALRGSIPDALSIIGGNSLLIISALLLHRAVAGFTHPAQRRADPVGWTLAALTVAWITWFTLVDPNITARLALTLNVAGFMMGRIARNVTVFSRSERGSPLSDVLSGLLWFYAFIFILTGLLIITGMNPLQSLAQPGPAGMSLFATRIVVLALIVLIFARLDLKEASKKAKAEAAPKAAAGPRQYVDSGQFAALAARAIGRADPKRRPLSIIVIELDNFKDVSSQHGNDAAQALLDWACTRISWTLRGNDVLERVGLDDFVVLMPDTGIQEALGRAERMRESIAQGVFNHGELRLSTTASAGGAALGTGRGTWEELLRAARASMSRARVESHKRDERAEHPVSGMRYRARA